MHALWSITDIAIPSVEDESILFDDGNERATIKRLERYHYEVGLLKRRNKGPVSIGGEALSGMTFAAADSVVDTMVAGDSFNGAFLATYFSAARLSEAALRGHECACRVVGHKGAILPKDMVNSNLATL